VWELLGVDPPTGDDPEPRGPIRREWHHVDLYIDTGRPGRKLVLENKVLAVATRDQLTGYYEKLRSLREFTRADPNDEVTSWRILTLLPLTFAAPPPWQQVTYADLVAPLQETADALAGDVSTADDAALVRGYARLVDRLVDLTSAVDIAGRLDQPVVVPHDLGARLREARLSPLVQKVRVARAASLLSEKLRGDHPDLPIPRVKADLTHGEALLEAFVPGPDGRQFGWQVQGTKVQLSMLTGDQDVATVAGRDAAAETFAGYFSFDDLPDHLLGLLDPYTGKRSWLGYKHEFVYRYRPLRPEVTWQQLIDLTAQLTTRALAYTAP
jgi:hypothetical protein